MRSAARASPLNAGSCTTAAQTPVLAAIRTTADGGTLLNPLAAAVMQRLRHPPAEAHSMFDVLTPAESEVLELVGRGMTNRQIAEYQGYAEKTVKNHVSGILRKLGMQSRTQVAIALVHEQEG